MRTLCDCPEGTRFEWRFLLFNTPVRVKVWFWITVLMLGGELPPAHEAIWISVCFVSILLHELGHAAACRMFGDHAEIKLYAWGGLTSWNSSFYGTMRQFVVSLAGPLAGFCLAGLALGLALSSGASIRVGHHLLIPVLAVLSKQATLTEPGLWYTVLNDLLWVNFFWGLVNLLPVYPLDGGQAARAVFERFSPAEGRRRSLILSVVVGAIMALLGLLAGSLWILLMFAIMAVSSMQLLDGNPPRTDSCEYWQR